MISPEAEQLTQAWRSGPPPPDLRLYIDDEVRTDPVRLAALVRADALERRRVRGLAAWAGEDLSSSVSHYETCLGESIEPGSPLAALLVRLELEDAAAEGPKALERAVAYLQTWDAQSVAQVLGDLERSGTFDPESLGTGPDSILGLMKGLGGSEDSGSASQLIPSDSSSQVPASIGPYRVLERIGEGGFGVVYRAEQSTPVHREVAVKVIKPGMDSSEVVARFEQERQALAVMNHPGLAHVYDAGKTGRGLPYFVMEFVPGEPITNYCDRHTLTVRERLKLFTQVCDAVQHAHMKGVIHRDIKPSNVLVVDGENGPVVKVIDFGVAKAVSMEWSRETLFTRHGHLVGTPEYMSPEQADLGATDIDTRTDVYSLGVLLYELLTGTTPFDAGTLRSAGLAEIQRIIREVDPPRPSTRLTRSAENGKASTGRRGASRVRDVARTRELSRELDWIPLKAMRKERTERYAGPSELAMDVNNYLAGRPLQARPETTAYLLRKFVRRNRGPVAAVAGVLVALAAGVVGTSVALYQVRLAQAAEAERADELERVVTFQEHSLTSLDALRMGVHVRELIADGGAAVLEPHELETLDAALSAVNFTDVARRAIEQSMFGDSARAIVEQFDDQPGLQARLLHTLAHTMRAIGMLDGAANAQERALSLRKRHSGEEHPHTLASMHNLGVMRRELAEHDASLDLLMHALDGRRRVLGPGAYETLKSEIEVANTLIQLGRFEEAVNSMRAVIETRERLLGPDHPDTMDALAVFASAMQLSDPQHPDTQDAYRRVIESYTRQQDSGEMGPDAILRYGAIVNNHAAWLLSVGHREEGIELLGAVRLHLREILGDSHPYTLAVTNTLGVGLHYGGQYEAATEHFQQVVAGRQLVNLENDPGLRTTVESLSRSLHWLGNTRYGAGDLAGAVEAYEESLRLYRKLPKIDIAELETAKRNLRIAMSNHARELVKHERFEEAEAVYQRAWQFVLDTIGPDHGDTLAIASLIVEMYEAWHDADPSPYHRMAEQWRDTLDQMRDDDG